MEESVFQPGSEILQVGDECKAVMFIVNGTVDVEIADADNNLYKLDTLKQGDTIGQYSVLFGQEFEFKLTAQTHVRLLKLTDHFFCHFSHQSDCCEQSISGFSQAIDRAQTYIDEFNIPFCDFNLFDYSKLNMQ